MQALYFEEKGDAVNVLKLGERTIPTLSENEIQIKVKASAINPADFMFIEKQYRVAPQFPQIAGFEGTGIITNNGGDKNFPINSKVAFRSKNVWAEYVNVPKDKIILVPDNLPFEKASQLSLNPLTAWALLEESGANENDWIILSAGNSTLCRLLIQFAKNRGIRTIPIVRNPKQKDELTNLGANLVLKAENEEVEQELNKLAKTERIAGFLDAVGGDLATTVIKSISPNSKIIHYGLYSDEAVQYHNSDVIFKNLTIKGFGIDGWINRKTKTELNNIWALITQELIRQDFIMDVSGKYPLTEFKKAITESKNAKTGKVLFWME